MKSTSALGLPPTAPFTPNHSSASSSSQVKKSFVFGSSTPRELSHIDKVSRKARLISSGSQPLGSNKAEGEELHKRGPDISFYMRKARSITPAGGRGDKATSWAFGSSTPRELSHLKSIRSDQRVYDAKVNHKPDVKSFTSSYISYKPASHVKPQSSNSRLMSNYIAKPKNSRLSDDASSEPDIVQDRSIDFHRKAAAAIKLVKKSQETINKDKKITKGSSKAVKESTPKKSKEPVKPKSNEEKKIKKNTSMEKKGKLEKKSPFEEQFKDACFFSFNLARSAFHWRYLFINKDTMLLKKKSSKKISMELVAPSSNKIDFNATLGNCEGKSPIINVKYSYSDSCNMKMEWTADIFYTRKDEAKKGSILQTNSRNVTVQIKNRKSAFKSLVEH